MRSRSDRSARISLGSCFAFHFYLLNRCYMRLPPGGLQSQIVSTAYSSIGHHSFVCISVSRSRESVCFALYLMSHKIYFIFSPMPGISLVCVSRHSRLWPFCLSVQLARLGVGSYTIALDRLDSEWWIDAGIDEVVEIGGIASAVLL